MPIATPAQVSQPAQTVMFFPITYFPSVPEMLPCEACGTRFEKAQACRIGNSDYCPSCDEERWNELIALQEEMSYGSTAMLSDWHDHSFAEMF